MPQEPKPLHTGNDCFVGALGADIVFIVPVPARLTKEKALNLAAWLVALADPVGEQFPSLLDAVRNT